jgi:alanine racemase
VVEDEVSAVAEHAITADELARRADSISWECLASISRRVPRFYRNP